MKSFSPISVFASAWLLLAGALSVCAAPQPQLFGTFPGRDTIYSATNTVELIRLSSVASAVNATNVSASQLQSSKVYANELVRTNTLAQDAKNQSSFDAVNQNVRVISNNVDILSASVASVQTQTIASVNQSLNTLYSSVALTQTQTLTSVNQTVAAGAVSATNLFVAHNSDPSAHSSYLATRTYVDNLVASVLVPPESAAAAYQTSTNAMNIATNAQLLAQETLPIATNAALVASDTAAALAALNARLNPSNMPSLVLRGSNTLSVGNGSQARAAGSAAFGVGAIASNIYAFVWNGIQSMFYGDRGPGTICLNPVGGAAGLYVGSNSLASVVDQAIGPYKRPRLLYGPADDTGFQAHSLGFDIPGLLVFYSVQGSPVSYSLDLIPIAYNTATQGVAMAQIALDRPTGTDTGAVIGVVGSVLATNKVYELSSPFDGTSLVITNSLLAVNTPTGVLRITVATEFRGADSNTPYPIFLAGTSWLSNAGSIQIFEGVYATLEMFTVGENRIGVTASGPPPYSRHFDVVFNATTLEPLPAESDFFVPIILTRIPSHTAYNLAAFPTNLVAGSNVLITGTKQNPTISATDTPGLVLVSNQVVSTISTLGSIAGTQGVHSASIAALYQTNDNTSQVIYGLFQSNSVVKTAVDYLAETQSVHTTSIAGLLQSNAEARVTLDAKLNTNGNGSALSGITASQVGAMSTSERTNYYTKAEGDLSAAAKVSISSGSATNLDLYADPQTFTGLTGSVTITNRAERPIVASGTGTVSLAFTGLKQMRPVYLTLGGFSSVSVPGGYAVGGWGEWQTNQVNHFLVWTVSTNLFLNAITTSGE